MGAQTIRKTKLMDGDELPANDAILHAEPAGKSGPLFVWYLAKTDD